MLHSIVQAISPVAFVVFLGWIAAALLATSRMWSDFIGEPVWRYQKLPPFLLPELEKDLPGGHIQASHPYIAIRFSERPRSDVTI
jgi:hypothetical protein